MAEERIFQSAHSCRSCNYWVEGDYSRLKEQALREMARGCCDPCWDLILAESPQVGICHNHKEPHIRNAYVIKDSDPLCRGFRRIPMFEHARSENANELAGFDCRCGEPWMDSHNRCSAGGSTYEQWRVKRADAKDRRWAQRMAA